MENCDFDVNFESVLFGLLQEGELLGRCLACGTYLSFEEATGQCPNCGVEVWPDRLVVQSVRNLPQC